MKIAEAMAEVKLAGKKIQTNFEFVMRNLGREEWRKDPFDKDGTTQAEEVKKAMQSTADLQTRIVALKNAINRVNQGLTLEVSGMRMTVAEWLIWRKEVLPIEKKMLQQLANQIANIGRGDQAAQVRRQFQGQAAVETPSSWIVNVSDKWLVEQIQKLDTIEQTLDGQLSILCATTDIELS